MSDEDWDLWSEYMSEKESFEDLYRVEFEEANPGEAYIKLSDEEYLQLMKEFHAA